MTEPTIVALVILIGVFVIMTVTIMKDGAERAIKMWGVMGALTGVAFGAIISFFFADQTYQKRIKDLNGQVELSELKIEAARTALADSVEKVNEVKDSIGFLDNIVQADPTSENSDVLTMHFTNGLSEDERNYLKTKMVTISSNLRAIEELGADWAKINAQEQIEQDRKQ